MKNIYKSFLALCFFLFATQSFYGQITFQKVYGGSLEDVMYSVIQTIDSGYIMAGETKSFGAGGWDAYLIKTDKYGDTLWTRTYGSTDSERANSIDETMDGGFIFGGSASTPGLAGYLVKTDFNGDTLWTKSFDGGIASVKQTNDSGYIITGSIYGAGAGLTDIFLLKMDVVGNVLWKKLYGGISDDYPTTVITTNDSGFAILGTTKSFGLGSRSIFLIKTNIAGNVQWSKTYGDAGDISEGNSIQQTYDGGFILTGVTGGYVSPNQDSYLIKTDSSGNILWAKTYGGTGDAWGNSIQITKDSGYIMAGYINLLPIFVSFVYLLKTDISGDTLWIKTYSNSNNDWGTEVEQSYDSGYVVGAISTAAQPGSANAYMIKTDGNGNTPCNEFNIATTIDTWSPQISSPLITTISGATMSVSTFTSVNMAGGVISNPCAIIKIDEFNKDNSILVYPNPFTNKIQIKGTDKNGAVAIFSLTGDELLRQKTSEFETTINVLSLSQGFYFLRYVQGDKSLTFKIVKSN